jgi:hypothetical protein
MPVNPKDRTILRELGEQVAQIAALPVQQETIRLWKALNGLRPERPMVIVDEVCWNEMETDGELVVRAQDEFCRELERDLRRTLYAWKHMRADMVIEPVVVVPKAITGTGFGIRVEEKLAITDPTSDIAGHHYLDQLQSEDDLWKICLPDARLDEEETSRREAIAHEVFDGILAVQMQGLAPNFAAWDRIVEWHGAEQVLLDLVMRPDFMHRVIARVTEVSLALLDQAEERGLLAGRLSSVHCSGAYTDELPAPGFDPGKARGRDLWTFGMAQIFSSVSPAMHQEFELAYASRWYARFGLVYYGCCEPLHAKLSLVKRIPHLRKISMSPWADVERGAEQIGCDFVFSSKPSPALLAGDSWEPEVVEADLRRTVEACAHHGCPVELILKDISTVRHQPQRLWEWERIARRVAEGGRRYV